MLLLPVILVISYGGPPTAVDRPIALLYITGLDCGERLNFNRFGDSDFALAGVWVIVLRKLMVKVAAHGGRSR
jgi:hypothetical protein